jgi:hypothetical protein
MEAKLLRQVLGRFKSVDTQPFRAVIPRGDEIPDSLDKALVTKTPFVRDEKGAVQHLAYQKLNDTEVELVQEPSPITFKDDIFDQNVFDFNDGQQDEIKEKLFAYIQETGGTKGFGAILIDGQRRKPKARKSLTQAQKPGDIKLNVKSGLDKAQSSRDKGLSFDPAAVKAALEKFGAPERYDEIKRHVSKGIQQMHVKRTKVNQKVGATVTTIGHIGSVKGGYLNTPENLMFEAARSNFSRQHKDDLPEEVLRMLGIFKSWEEYVAYYLFEDLQMDKILTKSDRKAIINGADFEKVYRRREALIEQSV